MRDKRERERGGGKGEREREVYAANMQRLKLG